jgi:hypothetical protein
MVQALHSFPFMATRTLAALALLFVAAGCANSAPPVQGVGCTAGKCDGDGRDGSVTAPTAIPVLVGGPDGNLNSPNIPVTICVPGTSECTTLQHVVIDTGSVGLRVFGPALRGLSLPMQALPDGGTLAECIEWTPSYWGPMSRADVALGSRTVQNVSIQVVDAEFGHLPTTCPTPVDHWAHDYDGILGLHPAVDDCSDSACAWPPYYDCNATICAPAPPPKGLQLMNVTALIDNGVTLRMPAVPVDGASSVSGTLILGVGTNPENTPSPSVRVVPTDSHANFPVSVDGSTYKGGFDTGSSFFVVRPEPGLPVCSDNPEFLCPSTPQQVDVDFLRPDGGALGSVALPIANWDQLPSGNLVFDNVGWQGAPTADLLIGMPFFYGRTVYVGFSGQQSTLGPGPAIGFD